jgi:hypothetical protein
MSRFIPHWRKATWAIVIWAILGVLWLWAGWSAVDTGNTAEAVGAGIGTGIVIFFWFLGFVILSIVWFMSRPRYVEYDGQMMSEKDALRLSKAKAKAIKDAGAGGGKPTPAT